jgi:hypothetical protein
MSLMSQAEFAKHIGRTSGYITQLKDAGRIVMQGRMVDVEASISLMNETQDPSKAGVAERHEQAREQRALSVAEGKQPGTSAPLRASAAMDDTAGNAGSSYQQSRAMKEKYNALQAQIAYEKEVGLLLVANEARAAVADGDAIIRNRLESLPDMLAPQLAAESDEQKIRTLLMDQVEQLLGELSRTFHGMIKS